MNFLRIQLLLQLLLQLNLLLNLRLLLHILLHECLLHLRRLKLQLLLQVGGEDDELLRRLCRLRVERAKRELLRVERRLVRVAVQRRR